MTDTERVSDDGDIDCPTCGQGHTGPSARNLRAHLRASRGEAGREIARLRGEIKAAFHELGGIGLESSKEFHRIGIDSARGILRRAISPPYAAEQGEKSPTRNEGERE